MANKPNANDFKETFHSLACTIKEKMKDNFDNYLFVFCLEPDSKHIIPDPDRQPCLEV